MLLSPLVGVTSPAAAVGLERRLRRVFSKVTGVSRRNFFDSHGKTELAHLHRSSPEGWPSFVRVRKVEICSDASLNMQLKLLAL